MSSIQERLQLKRVPLDTWNIREKLCLASAVVRSGDQNWMSVSRSLKTIGDPNRPADWYSQKSCAAQYGALLEHVDTPKRKKRSSEGGAETPQESILKRLTQERMNEIQDSVAEINRQYEVLKNEITEARNPNCSEERLREMWTEIETAKRARERENARRAAWLKEREEKRARAERTWRPPTQPNAGVATTPSSPLLTSLLKSSPVVTTPQNISHPANVIETVSPSAGAPTLSMLLESNKTQGTPRPASPDNKHAAIEHIKSQLVQIERQLKEKTSTPPPEPLPVPTVDIDDIEIKAEDVYAFRDIDLHIPPVASMHKTAARPVEKPLNKKDEEVSIVTAEDPAVQEHPVQEIKEEVLPASTPLPQEPREVSPILHLQPELHISITQSNTNTKTVDKETTNDATGLTIGFPTPEIKVIPSEEPIKTETKDGAGDDKCDVEEDVNVEIVEEVSEKQPDEPSQPPPEPIEPQQIEPQLVQVPEVVSTEPAVETIEETQPTDVGLAVDSVVEEPTSEPPLPEETPQEEKEIKQELIEERTEEKIEEGQVENKEEILVEIPLERKVDLVEEQLKQLMPEESLEEPQPPSEPEVKDELPVESEETHTETDDDAPMEVSREEEKDGKKRRDYSRKALSSRTWSGSEGDSPGRGSEADRQQRAQRKQHMLVYSRLCAHKYASLFLRPITDDEAPGYSLVVKRPMDLSTIRRNIESGAIRTTAEFQRDVLLMLTNALMYNSSEHSVYAMAKEMMEEAQNQLSMLVAAQAHAGLEPAPPARRKRRRPASPQITVTPKRTV